MGGITPFSQMHGFVASFERRDLAEKTKPAKVGLKQPIQIDGRWFDSVTVSHRVEDAPRDDGLWMAPLRTPLAAGGFTAHSLSMLKEAFPDAGLLPLQAGDAAAKAATAGQGAANRPR